MRQQEINFKCGECAEDVIYRAPNCLFCRKKLNWADIRRDYQDKYLEIYKVYV